MRLFFKQHYILKGPGIQAYIIMTTNKYSIYSPEMYAKLQKKL